MTTRRRFLRSLSQAAAGVALLPPLMLRAKPAPPAAPMLGAADNIDVTVCLSARYFAARTGRAELNYILSRASSWRAYDYGNEYVVTIPYEVYEEIRDHRAVRIFKRPPL